MNKEGSRERPTIAFEFRDVPGFDTKSTHVTTPAEFVWIHGKELIGITFLDGKTDVVFYGSGPVEFRIPRHKDSGQDEPIIFKADVPR